MGHNHSRSWLVSRQIPLHLLRPITELVDQWLNLELIGHFGKCNLTINAQGTQGYSSDWGETSPAFGKHSACGCARVWWRFSGCCRPPPAPPEWNFRRRSTELCGFATEDGGIETLLLDARSVQSGHELRYTIEFTNTSSEIIDPGVIVITNPIPETVEYLEGTAIGRDTEIEFSADGGTTFAGPQSLTVVENGAQVPAMPRHYTAIRFTFGGILGPGEGSAVAFDVRLLEETPLDGALAESVD